MTPESSVIYVRSDMHRLQPSDIAMRVRNPSIQLLEDAIRAHRFVSSLTKMEPLQIYNSARKRLKFEKQCGSSLMLHGAYQFALRFESIRTPLEFSQQTLKYNGFERIRTEYFPPPPEMPNSTGSSRKIKQSYERACSTRARQIEDCVTSGLNYGIFGQFTERERAERANLILLARMSIAVNNHPMEGGELFYEGKWTFNEWRQLSSYASYSIAISSPSFCMVGGFLAVLTLVKAARRYKASRETDATGFILWTRKVIAMSGNDINFRVHPSFK